MSRTCLKKDFYKTPFCCVIIGCVILFADSVKFTLNFVSNFTKNIIEHTPFNAYLCRLSWNSAFRINEYTSRKIVDEQWGDVHEKIRAEFAKLKADNQLTLLKDNSPYYCLYKHKNVGYIDWGCNF